MQTYLKDLNAIPHEHRALFEAYNDNVAKAFAKAARGEKTLTRSVFGGYVVARNDELVSIEQYDSDAPAHLRGEWIARECSNLSRWYSDPAPTLKSLRSGLNV